MEPSCGHRWVKAASSVSRTHILSWPQQAIGQQTQNPEAKQPSLYSLCLESFTESCGHERLPSNHHYLLPVFLS